MTTIGANTSVVENAKPLEKGDIKDELFEQGSIGYDKLARLEAGKMLVADANGDVCESDYFEWDMQEALDRIGELYESYTEIKTAVETLEHAGEKQAENTDDLVMIRRRVVEALELYSKLEKRLDKIKPPVTVIPKSYDAQFEEINKKFRDVADQFKVSDAHTRAYRYQIEQAGVKVDVLKNFVDSLPKSTKSLWWTIGAMFVWNAVNSLLPWL